jgi:hypothetical protein
MKRHWWTVIGRYEDEPQTVADWQLFGTAKEAMQKSADERGSECYVIAAFKGKLCPAWTPEHVEVQS